MRRAWSVEELHELWSVMPSDVERLPHKGPVGRLGFTAQLAFYRVRGHWVVNAWR